MGLSLSQRGSWVEGKGVGLGQNAAWRSCRQST